MVSLFHALPTVLVAFLLASPALTAPTSENNPLRAIASHAPRPQEQPICCLKPTTHLDSVEDDVLLSFEEWKAKQSVLKAQEDAKAKDRDSSSHNGSGVVSAGDNGTRNDPQQPLVVDVGGSFADPGSPLPHDDALNSQKDEAISPHFRVPLTDRFNYASTDCSARIHAAHRSAKSASSILLSKRDKYMLSPCSSPKGEKQFVIVELCEDVRIDTVQLANFEFFSGVFKEFTVSVAKTSTDEGWVVAGTYKAKNIRGVQSFHPPRSLRDFYRYLRIDFHSHYGNEYYCPVSLLRVYGLTHLEQWKWDIWEAESRLKRDGLLQPGSSIILQPVLTPSEPIPTESQQITGSSNSSELEDNTKGGPSRSGSPTVPAEPPALSHEPSIGDSSLQNESASHSPATAATRDLTFDDSLTRHLVSSEPLMTPSPTVKQPSALATIPPEVPRTTLTISSRASNTASPVHQDTPRAAVNAESSESPTIEAPTSTTSIATSLGVLRTATAAVSSSPPAPPIATVSSVSSTPVLFSGFPPLPAALTGGESIYRTIMNRLSALEANHTLYMRYVEQQTSGLRDVLRRLGEDVGRLEGIGRAQAIAYQRTTQEWERQRYQMQMEYGMLMSRMDYLSDEIILEKRLGIAQLCLLVAVLVFMGLTRGSRGESFIQHAPIRLNRSFREWGRRHLSRSNDWADRPIKNDGRDPSPETKTRKRSPRPSPLNFNSDLNNIVFPMTKNPPDAGPLELNTINLASLVCIPPESPHSQSIPVSRKHAHRPRTPSLVSSSSSRTPTSRHFSHNPYVQKKPTTPAYNFGFSEGIQRSQSHGETESPMSSFWENARTGSAGVGAGAGTTAGISGPKSARRWARTAHIHEVRTHHPHHARHAASSSASASLPSKATAGKKENGRGEWSENDIQSSGDVFTSPSKGSSFRRSAVSGAAVGTATTMTATTRRVKRGDGQEPAYALRRPPSLNGPLFAKAEGRDEAGAGAGGEGDMWVDTDFSTEDGGLDLTTTTQSPMSSPSLESTLQLPSIHR